MPSVPGPDAGRCVEGAVLAPGLLVNARDLGGLPLSSGTVACGQLLRAAAPSSSSVCTPFAQLGVKTVIDLRVASERQNVPDADCVQAQARVVLAPMPIPYNVSPTDYVTDLHTDAAVKALFDTLGDEANYPVLLHCTYGRDRSGVATALVLLALGADRPTIQRDYQRTAENGLSAFPASLDAVLDAVERAGGIDAHLAAVGVDPASVETLRRVARQ